MSSRYPTSSGPPGLLMRPCRDEAERAVQQLRGNHRNIGVERHHPPAALTGEVDARDHEPASDALAPVLGTDADHAQVRLVRGERFGRPGTDPCVEFQGGGAGDDASIERDEHGRPIRAAGDVGHPLQVRVPAACIRSPVLVIGARRRRTRGSVFRCTNRPDLDLVGHPVTLRDRLLSRPDSTLQTMDPDTSNPGSGTTDGDGQYFRRAQALMARRAELFATVPSLSLERAAAVGPTPQDRAHGTRRSGGRQLSLPISRERGRRRARMLR